VLLLRNGSVLRGLVTCVGDHYLVTFGEQGEARMPVADVELSCTTLEEAYAHLRDAIRPGDVAAHLRVADWCHRQGLTARAADQLLMVFVLDPTNRRLELLERRLIFGSSSVGEKAPGVVSESGAESVSPAVEGPSSAEPLPPGAVEYFTQKVQPILLNRCAANGCHNPRVDGTFQLAKPARGQSIPLRTTQRNLRSALSLVNRGNPSDSPLLSLPFVPHGGISSPVLSAANAKERQFLIAWVGMLATGTGQGPASVGSTEVRTPSDRAAPAPVVRPIRGTVASAQFAAPASGASEVQRAGMTVGDSSQLPGGERPSRDTEAHDPFDPEVFNARYAAGSLDEPPAASGASAPAASSPAAKRKGPGGSTRP
jgi:hypothetical protein